MCEAESLEWTVLCISEVPQARKCIVFIRLEALWKKTLRVTRINGLYRDVPRARDLSCSLAAGWGMAVEVIDP